MIKQPTISKKNKSNKTFSNEQTESKVQVIDKPSHNAPSMIIPTSIVFTALTLAKRLEAQQTKKNKFSWCSKMVYEFR